MASYGILWYHPSLALLYLNERVSDLNGSSIEVLERPPTALEFSRLVNASRPVVINGLELSATRKWTNGYLVRKMEMRRISVAVTPDGRADAITEGPDNKHYFVEPFVDHMTMEELLSRLATNSNQSEICYLQSQNGNLYSSTYFGGQAERDPSEFEPLRKDVPPEISWCSEALDRSPDAVNLWIGDGKSSTSIHCDPYENIYTVVRGAKHFTLLPPTEGYYLKERWYPHGQYTRSSNTDLQMTPSPPTVSHVRWSSILDPNEPQALPPEAHPIHVSLLPGQTLYLPAGWWHHVRQAPEITIALNWWYDTEMRGMSWILLSFMRKLCSPGENCEEESMTN